MSDLWKDARRAEAALATFLAEHDTDLWDHDVERLETARRILDEYAS